MIQGERASKDLWEISERKDWGGGCSRVLQFQEAKRVTSAIKDLGVDPQQYLGKPLYK